MLKVLIVVLSICYPFMVYWGLQHYDANLLFPMLLIFMGIRWLATNDRLERYVLLATIIAVTIVIFIWDGQLGLKFYPVMMNVGFLVLFGSTLFSSCSFVERLARIREPNLSPQAVIYTRKVTWAWSLFFVLNGSIAAMTALWASDEVWVVYNGMIAYVLMGILAASEWLIRQNVKRA